MPKAGLSTGCAALGSFLFKKLKRPFICSPAIELFCKLIRRQTVFSVLACQNIQRPKLSIAPRKIIAAGAYVASERFSAFWTSSHFLTLQVFYAQRTQTAGLTAPSGSSISNPSLAMQPKAASSARISCAIAFPFP